MCLFLMMVKSFKRSAERLFFPLLVISRYKHYTHMTFKIEKHDFSEHSSSVKQVKIKIVYK